jgi:hypothetical protein
LVSRLRDPCCNAEGATQLTEHDVCVSAEHPASEVRAVIEAKPGTAFRASQEPDRVPAPAIRAAKAFIRNSHAFEERPRFHRVPPSVLDQRRGFGQGCHTRPLAAAAATAGYAGAIMMRQLLLRGRGEAR